MGTLIRASLAVLLLGASVQGAEAIAQNEREPEKPRGANHPAKLTGFMERTKIIQADQAIVEKLKVADAKMKLARRPDKNRKGPQTFQEAADFLNRSMQSHRRGCHDSEC